MNPVTTNKLPSVSELNAIKLRAESLALVLEQYQKSGDHGMLETLETMRTELILAILANHGVGQELIRRLETVKPDLLQEEESTAEAIVKHGGFCVPEKGYEPLFDVLMAAHDQAAKGKGRERHAGADDLPFLEQRMQRISDLLKTPDGMAYQIIKKVTEGLEMSDPKACERELLGAIVYTAGAILWLRDNWLLDGENGGGDQ